MFGMPRDPFSLLMAKWSADGEREIWERWQKGIQIKQHRSLVRQRYCLAKKCLLFVALGAVACAVYFRDHIGGLAAAAVVAFVLSIVSQVGDLAESAVKRRFNAKDSSHLIPGHGGLMDRLDGFVTASVAAVMIGLARGGFEAPGRGLLVW